MIILNESKIKYDRLDQLFSDVIRDLRFSENVNVIVDLKEVYRKFFRPDILENIKFDSHSSEEITSDIINIISHYRNYFYKKNKYTTFYFLYSKDKCEEILKEYPGYKKDYYEKYIEPTDENIQKQVNFFKVVTKSLEKIINTIPHARFIETSKHDELVYTRAILGLIPSNELTIILTNDDIMFQLLKPNVFILNLKGIKSDLVSEKNAVSILTKRETTLSANMIPLIIALGGDKKYSISGSPRIAITKATKIVEALVADGSIVDAESIACPVEFSKLNDDKLAALLKSNMTEISEKYYLIRNDKNYLVNKKALELEVSMELPKKDFQFFFELNSKVFSMFPIMIDMLLKGEK